MPVSQFLASFRTAFESSKLLKCTLSKPTSAAPEDLKNVYLRPVQLKKGLFVAFNFRYKTRDEAKNFDLDEAIQRIQAMLGKEFLNADLLTPDRDYNLSFSKNGEPVFFSKKASHAGTPDTAHDRPKHRLLDPAAPWLHALGVANAKGQVLADAQDKWRQINKYLEIIESLLRECPLPLDAHIADMGSGKGYLTFALYDFLKNKMSMAPQITGIELRPELVEFCNKTAQDAGFQGLKFISQDISEFRPERLDMLIALHACDTATDLALAAGIHNKAKIIVVAPCCHKQIRKEMQARNELAPLLRHGILEERQAEIVTDGIRALLLEAEGYETRVFEFISTEHTAKNVMITATVNDKRLKAKDQKPKALEKVAALKAGFGFQEHYLEKLLENNF
jgi:SAM-dependent methyltransferase